MKKIENIKKVRMTEDVNFEHTNFIFEEGKEYEVAAFKNWIDEGKTTLPLLRGDIFGKKEWVDYSCFEIVKPIVKVGDLVIIKDTYMGKEVGEGEVYKVLEDRGDDWLLQNHYGRYEAPKKDCEYIGLKFDIGEKVEIIPGGPCLKGQIVSIRITHEEDNEPYLVKREIDEQCLWYEENELVKIEELPNIEERPTIIRKPAKDIEEPKICINPDTIEQFDLGLTIQVVRRDLDIVTKKVVSLRFSVGESQKELNKLVEKQDALSKILVELNTAHTLGVLKAWNIGDKK